MIHVLEPCSNLNVQRQIFFFFERHPPSLLELYHHMKEVHKLPTHLTLPLVFDQLLAGEMLRPLSDKTVPSSKWDGVHDKDCTESAKQRLRSES
jgi:hypothetical protein